MWYLTKAIKILKAHLLSVCMLEFYLHMYLFVCVCMYVCLSACMQACGLSDACGCMHCNHEKNLLKIAILNNIHFLNNLRLRYRLLSTAKFDLLLFFILLHNTDFYGY